MNFRFAWENPVDSDAEVPHRDSASEMTSRKMKTCPMSPRKTMEAGSLKPLLTALVMPPVPAVVLGGVALLAIYRGRRAWALGLCVCTVLTIWLMGSQGVAIRLGRWLLPPVPALQASDIKRLRAENPGAIVVLGSGVRANAPEYGGQPALAPIALERLVYGIRLSRETGWPLMYAGGQGWAERAVLQPLATETAAARQTAAALGTPLAWADDRSRDTHENALESAGLLRPLRIQRVILVTNSWHMPRATREFHAAGLTVIPAPMGYIGSTTSPWLEWLPSAGGMATMSIVVREWLGLQVQRWRLRGATSH